MKLSELKKQIEDAITEILGEGEAEERVAKEAEKKSIDAQIKALTMKKAEINKSGVVAETEDEDDDSSTEKEPTKSELRKNAGVAKIKDELAKVTKKMKDLVKEYSKAEGDKKDKIKNQLKSLTSEKKDLEKRLDKSL